MLLVRRGEGFPGAAAAWTSGAVSSDLLTIDAISPRVFRLNAAAVIFCTAQRLGYATACAAGATTSYKSSVLTLTVLLA